MKSIIIITLCLFTLIKTNAQNIVNQPIPLEFAANTGVTVFNQSTYGATLFYLGNSWSGKEITMPINVSTDIVPALAFKIDLDPKCTTQTTVNWAYTIHLIGIDNKDIYYCTFNYRKSANRTYFQIVVNTPNSGIKAESWAEIQQIPSDLCFELVDNTLTFLQEWRSLDAHGNIGIHSINIGNIKGVSGITFKMVKGISLRVQNPTIAIPSQYAANLNKKPSNPNTQQKEYFASGSGFILSKDGIVATNFHVIDGANGIDVFINRNGAIKTYKAKVLISDKTNDISLLKIEDDSFVNFSSIPYAIKTSIQDVGTGVFALGYPMSNILGEEIKVTDGIISSKTGYKGDVVTYQISAPIQAGNSGGPLFDKLGNIVGITNAGIPDAQNVGYAIKTSYLKNLLDSAPMPIALPVNNTISGLQFTEKIKRLTPFVVLIKIY